MGQSDRTRSGSKSTSVTPNNWPPGVVYLHQPCYSKRLQTDAAATLTFSKSDLPSTEEPRKCKGPFANVKITPIFVPSHPANGQSGLFAAQHLPPDTFILPYIGYVHGPNDLDENSDYDLSLDRELGIGVDASKMGNEARFINDYRGVSAAPNAEFRHVFVDVGKGRVEKRMGVFVLSAGKSGKRAKGIEKGREILVSYGKGFWTERMGADG
ncbi:hypothetical protein DM02DRAFT_617262 [Periconia macrospinosa]|uniref:SET domain-containing protein n=1 Tax=Periconia macrospinosa TaxID=97972 RepID=A0A2V1DDW2_9PLEO|nr:hypothetical protein DM02DRAFT_617262 [Periconia macrospinosa]